VHLAGSHEARRTIVLSGKKCAPERRPSITEAYPMSRGDVNIRSSNETRGTDASVRRDYRPPI
jgi:hypothetical protein